MGIERIWNILEKLQRTEDEKKANAVLARAEANMPLTPTGNRTIEIAPVVPVTPTRSLSGGFHMSETEKAHARRDAIKGSFSI